MGRYLELLKSSRIERESSVEPREEKVEEELASRRSETEEPIAIPFPGKDALTLTAAGYKSKVSFSGKTIWRSPDTGLWFSEEMARCFLERRNVKNKAGAEEER